MKKILVLGSTGQIGTALKKDLTKWCEATFLNRNDLDFVDIESLSAKLKDCLLYTSPSPRDRQKSRMPSSA